VRKKNKIEIHVSMRVHKLHVSTHRVFLNNRVPITLTGKNGNYEITVGYPIRVKL